ncbi:MAG: hypothetical protein N3A54_04005 [Patescibacteria group bacterium]|nr:hypothetical protein [Patescibacteria group bacterium]
MKRIIITLLIILFIIPPLPSLAVTKLSSPSATPVDKDIKEKIDDLKDRLATKVAELRKTSPKAIFGTVTEISVSSATIDAGQKAYKIELPDDLSVTQILRGRRTKLKADDIKKNDTVTVFGSYDETLDVLQAKHVFIESQKFPVRLHGMITDINRKDNTFTLKGADETNYTIDVEPITKNNTWTQQRGVEKSGFSKLEKGMYTTIVGIENATQQDRYTATRILTWKIEKIENNKDEPEPTTNPTPTVVQKLSPSLTPSPRQRTTSRPSPSPSPRRTPQPTPTP